MKSCKPFSISSFSCSDVPCGTTVHSRLDGHACAKDTTCTCCWTTNFHRLAWLFHRLSSLKLQDGHFHHLMFNPKRRSDAAGEALQQLRTASFAEAIINTDASSCGLVISSFIPKFSPVFTQETSLSGQQSATHFPKSQKPPFTHTKPDLSLGYPFFSNLTLTSH